MDETTGVVSSKRANRHFEEEGPILCAALDKIKLPSFPEYKVRVSSGEYIRSHLLRDCKEAKHTATVVNKLSKEISKILIAHPLNAKRTAKGKSIANIVLLRGTDISQKDEKPIKKRQNRTRDGKVCEIEAKSKSSLLREEKAKKNIT
ncbi:2,3-bisphosphoglycerate-independent phosphoglycerate mutase [Tanacetum coccineum]